MKKEDVIEYALSLPNVYEDYPFGGSTTVLRHSGNKKSFILLIHAHGRLYVNMKCEPLRADALRQTYAGVIPGYHMNKEHWNSVFLEEDVPEEVICHMIDVSYELTRPKIRIKKNGGG